MAHQNVPSARLRRIRKLIARAKREQHAKRGQPAPSKALPHAWASALARVKKHIQDERRHPLDAN